MEAARAAHPEECCGVLLGVLLGAGEPGRVRVERVIAAPNQARDRGRAFEIAPEDLLAAHLAARAAGHEVVGYYHSHPSGPAQPSARDRREALPEASYVILVAAPGSPPVVRSWRLAPDGELVEEDLLGATIGAAEDGS